MKNLKSLFSITDNCMKEIDLRVKKHLINVSYIAIKYAEKNNFDEMSTRALTIAGYLHDMGIVTTGKVDDLLESEEGTLVEHSVLGYMYLKYCSSEVHPDVIMYHHVPYANIPDINDHNKYLANILNLIDRLDFIIADSLKFESIEESIEYINKRVDVIKDQYYENIYEEFKVFLDEDIILKFKTGDHIEEFDRYLEQSEVTDEAYYLFLSSLVYLIESQSILTAGHSHITAQIAKEVAKLVGLDEDKQDTLYYAGILHDIGKIAVSQEILKKPSNLTEEEFVEMKNHAKYSADILKDNIPDEIYYPATRHHENLNGTGYPNGFKELTLEDEIIRISDITAALAENRYYRGPLPIEKVIEVITDDYNKGNCSDKIFHGIVDNIEYLYKLVSNIQHERANRYQELIHDYVDDAKELSKINFQHVLEK